MSSDEGVVWTGENVYEMEEFAEKSDFGFVVGSSYHNEANKTDDSDYPDIDNTVLEIFPDTDIEDLDKPWHWTTATIGDTVYADGTVTRGKLT